MVLLKISLSESVELAERPPQNNFSRQPMGGEEAAALQPPSGARIPACFSECVPSSVSRSAPHSRSPVPLIVLPRSCSCRWGPHCPSPIPRLAWLFSFFLSGSSSMAVLAPTQPSYLRMAELAVLETGTSMHCITSPRPWACSDRRTFSCRKPPCHPRPSPRLSTPSRSMMCQGVCPSRLPLLIAFVKLVPVQVRNLFEVIQSAHMLLEYAPPMTLWLGPCGASDEAAQPIALARWQSLARPQSLRGAGPGRAARSCGTTTQERGHEAHVPSNHAFYATESE